MNTHIVAAADLITRRRHFDLDDDDGGTWSEIDWTSPWTIAAIAIIVLILVARFMIKQRKTLQHGD